MSQLLEWINKKDSYMFYNKAITYRKDNISLKEKIFRIPVSNQEYNNIFNFIKNINNDKEYMFNYISALFMFVSGGKKVYKSFHCVEFVSEAIDLINYINLPKEAYKMHPIDLYSVLKPYLIDDKIIYSKDFIIKDNSIFLSKIKTKVAIKKSIYSVKESIYRSIF